MNNPWIKFYPRDWRGDQALRAVSIAARGLWMEMLCIMHEASPYGHLILGGQPVSNDVLARMAGGGVDEVSALLIELENAGVLSRTRKGVIYSRRMVKDKWRSEKGRKAVKKRWEQPDEITGKNGQPNRSPNRTPTTQKPEARDSGSNEPAVPATLSERLWSDGLAYLKQTGMPESRARPQLGKWRKALGGADGGDARLLALIADCQAKSISDPNTYIEQAVRKAASPDDARKAFLEREYGQGRARPRFAMLPDDEDDL